MRCQRRSARRSRSYSRRRVRISAPPGAPCPTERRLRKPGGRTGDQVKRRRIHRVEEVVDRLRQDVHDLGRRGLDPNPVFFLRSTAEVVAGDRVVFSFNRIN